MDLVSCLRLTKLEIVTWIFTFDVDLYFWLVFSFSVHQIQWRIWVHGQIHALVSLYCLCPIGVIVSKDLFLCFRLWRLPLVNVVLSPVVSRLWSMASCDYGLPLSVSVRFVFGACAFSLQFGTWLAYSLEFLEEVLKLCGGLEYR